MEDNWLRFEIQSEGFPKKLVLVTHDAEIHIREEDYSQSITLTLDEFQQIIDGLKEVTAKALVEYLKRAAKSSVFNDEES